MRGSTIDHGVTDMSVMASQVTVTLTYAAHRRDTPLDCVVALKTVTVTRCADRYESNRKHTVEPKTTPHPDVRHI